MADTRLGAWETLFKRALEVIDSVAKAGITLDDWSFGGGTVLMRRYRHRLSKDIDIFVPDPQYLTYLSPRLNATAESLTSKYLEDARFVKLYFPEGEIDFVAATALTRDATGIEQILGRDVKTETSIEIIAKKVWHRGKEFTARDMFDLALVAQKESKALGSIDQILKERRGVILERIEKYEAPLRQTFAALETLDFRPSYEECVEMVKRVFK